MYDSINHYYAHASHLCQNSDKFELYGINAPSSFTSRRKEKHMRIAIGKTRIVILTDTYAIKIARFRFVRPLVQLVRHLIKGEVKKRLQKFDADPVVGGYKYLFAGVRANLTEWYVYDALHLDILAPTLWSFKGIVNLQRRGRPVTEAQLRTHIMRRLLFLYPVEDDDTMHPHQFCKIDRRVVLADYGRSELIPALTFYKKLISPA